MTRLSWTAWNGGYGQTKQQGLASKNDLGMGGKLGGSGLPTPAFTKRFWMGNFYRKSIDFSMKGSGPHGKMLESRSSRRMSSGRLVLTCTSSHNKRPFLLVLAIFTFWYDKNSYKNEDKNSYKNEGKNSYKNEAGCSK